MSSYDKTNHELTHLLNNGEWLRVIIEGFIIPPQVRFRHKIAFCDDSEVRIARFDRILNNFHSRPIGEDRDRLHLFYENSIIHNRQASWPLNQGPSALDAL